MTTASGLNGGVSAIVNNSEIALAVGVVAVLMVMILPLPPMLLDLLISFNITMAIILLLVGLYIMKPLELSSFPSILLLVTLFRLSLNVASTRIILLHGDEGILAAGKVIKAFGSFVVGGNYVVGLIVFLILVVINFVVITKGAGRIAEVAARFTLDAMPGKQMSIDADLNAGLIDEHEARDRRMQVSQEAEYYGAMDGANKFVRGDAIAGIVITLINIVGGLAIGVLQRDMSFADAAQNYTLLTVGDGLVSQIPALIISTTAGIIVSRAAAAEANLGREISAQLLVQPRAIAIAAAVLFGLGLVPGLPVVPFVTLALLAGGLAYVLFKARRTAEKHRQGGQEAHEALPGPEPVAPPPPLDALSLSVGYGLIPLVDAEQNGELLDRIRSIRRQTAQELGLLIPSVHIQDDLQLKPGEYAISLKGNEVARGELRINCLLAMNPGNADEKINGVPTKEPTFGLPAFWIKENEKEKAMAKGFTVVDLATVLTTNLSEVIRRHSHELLGRQETQQMLDVLKESHPKVVEELVPGLLALGTVVKVLQHLLKEQVPVRDLLTICETLADWAPMTRDPEVLTEYVRQALARTITRQYVGADQRIDLVTLDPNVERALADAIQQTEHGSFLAVEPNVAEKIIGRLTGLMEKFTSMSRQPVVLCSSRIRTHFRKLIERFIPDLAVLSYEEILNHVQIRSLGTVELSDAD